jgi:hypothetical protein
MGHALKAPRGDVKLPDIQNLLAGGYRFAPGSRLAHVMTAFEREVVETANSELDSHGYIEVRSPSGELVRYNRDPHTSSWQRTV